MTAQTELHALTDPSIVLSVMAMDAKAAHEGTQA